MKPVKCMFYLVATVFVVSCTGSSQNEGGQQPPEQTTPARADPTPADQPTTNPAPTNQPPAAQIENPLNVDPIPQEAAMSCWAACGEMIMRYVRRGTAWENIPAPRQCQQTEHEYPAAAANCCDSANNNTMRDGCSKSGLPEFTAWNFTCDTSFGTPLPWDDTTNPTNSITGQIDARRPIAFSWQIDGEGSHMMVLIGYNSDAGDKTITYLSPDPGGATKMYSMIPLADYNGEDPNYQHEYDFYNIQVSVDPPQ